MQKRTINVGFEGKRTLYNRSGLGNYSRNLINALVSQNSFDLKYTLFTPKTSGSLSFSSKAMINIVEPRFFVHKLLRSVWRSKWIVKDLVLKNIDIYHGLSHELPIGLNESGIKSIVTVHDLIFMRMPHLFNPIDVFLYTRKIKYACRVADRIVAISNQTCSDIIDILGVNPDKIVVIRQGCNDIFRNMESLDKRNKTLEKYKLPKNYLLYLGTIEERKNLLIIVKTLKEHNIDIPLIAIGRKTGYFYNKVLPYINKHSISSVYFPENVPDEDLPAIYQNSLCFIYPSLYEGFGIPILEALTSGVPVITSKGGCFYESGGDAAIYIDPMDTKQIALAVSRIASDVAYRDELIRRGIKYSRNFSQETIAKNYEELYRRTALDLPM